MLLVMSVWVSPCQTRSIELDIRYLLSIWSQIYRIPLRAGLLLLLLYTVIITENYNQFYHQSTLTQCTQNRLASPYAISPISTILQNIKICQKAIWVKFFLMGVCAMQSLIHSQLFLPIVYNGTTFKFDHWTDKTDQCVASQHALEVTLVSQSVIL